MNADLTIMGGGLAGLTLALQCRDQLPNAKIVVLEKRQHPVPEAAHKVGESTVEVGAHYFGNVLGLKEHIHDRQLPKLGLRFFFPAGDNSKIELRRELGGKRYAPCPSYQLDRGRFENFLADLCLERGIQFRDRSDIKNIGIGRFGAQHRVMYNTPNGEQEVSSKWLVDASGRRAFLKRQLGLQKDSPHKANAVWFRFSKHIKVDDWSRDASWHAGHAGDTARWYSTNHLMGKGYWVWMIPLASGSTSLGIVAADEFHNLSDFNSLEKAVRWLEKHEPQCAEAVKSHLDHIQDFRAIKHYATECQRVFSAQRWGITGEAGFFHDPFYSPGSDFIAFANTFLTDLIQRDLNGQGFRIRAFAYDRIFKRFYYGTSTAYLNQYQIFGNPTVMPVKILWDYLVYWSITGFIYMQGRMCEQMMYVRNLSWLSRLGRLNHAMQHFFRDWHQKSESDQRLLQSIDISQIPIIREANSSLLQSRSTKDFLKQFAHNVEQLEMVASDIVSRSGTSVDYHFQRPKYGAKAGAFDSIFT